MRRIHAGKSERERCFSIIEDKSPGGASSGLLAVRDKEAEVKNKDKNLLGLNPRLSYEEKTRTRGRALSHYSMEGS